METYLFHDTQLDLAAEGIKRGELVAFPTETVYGLGADALNEDAVKNVYLAKGRPSDNPLIVHVSSKEMVWQYAVGESEMVRSLMDAFWPGPLTLIFSVRPDSLLSKTVTGGLDTAAFRMPNHPLSLALISQVNTPLVGPSANTSGKPSPTTAEHVLHDLKGKIYGVLDGGKSNVGIESTVLDLSQPQSPTILRPGIITAEELEAVIGPVYLDANLSSETEAPRAPGMKYKHYSPDVPVIMVEGDTTVWNRAIQTYQAKGYRVGVLGNKQLLDKLSHLEFEGYELSTKRDVIDAMAHLFDGLRALDTQFVGSQGIILAETYPEIEQGIAFMNRLKKAANQTFFSK